MIGLVYASMALMAPAALQARVEAFTGRPAIVDPRLILPDCATPAIGWAGASVAVTCAAPAWRVFVPVVGVAVAAAPFAPPSIRRGDRVVVEISGPGFVVGLETVADGDARDGRVPLRAGGRRLTGIIGADGRVRING